MTERSGVDHPEVIDVVTHDPTKTHWKLIVVEAGSWDGSPERLLLLQEKLNSYLRFITSGQMARLYPESAGKSVAIQIDLYEKPDEATTTFVDEVRSVLRKSQIPLYMNLPPSAD